LIWESKKEKKSWRIKAVIRFKNKDDYEKWKEYMETFDEQYHIIGENRKKKEIIVRRIFQSEKK
jgi:cell fate regulator YaaT (PSP1 superfamily)